MLTQYFKHRCSSINKLYIQFFALCFMFLLLSSCNMDAIREFATYVSFKSDREASQRSMEKSDDSFAGNEVVPVSTDIGLATV